MRFLQRLALGRLHARLPEWVRIAIAVAALILGVVIVIRPTTTPRPGTGRCSSISRAAMR